MIEKIKTKLHDLLVRLRARWIIVVGLIAPFAAFAPEIWEGVQSIDYTGLSLKGAAVAVGLIVLRVVAVRGLAMLIAAPASADDKAP